MNPLPFQTQHKIPTLQSWWRAILVTFCKSLRYWAEGIVQKKGGGGGVLYYRHTDCLTVQSCQEKSNEMNNLKASCAIWSNMRLCRGRPVEAGRLNDTRWHRLRWMQGDLKFKAGPLVSLSGHKGHQPDWEWFLMGPIHPTPPPLPSPFHFLLPPSLSFSCARYSLNAVHLKGPAGANNRLESQSW